MAKKSKAKKKVRKSATSAKKKKGRRPVAAKKRKGVRAARKKAARSAVRKAKPKAKAKRKVTTRRKPASPRKPAVTERPVAARSMPAPRPAPPPPPPPALVLPPTSPSSWDIDQPSSETESSGDDSEEQVPRTHLTARQLEEFKGLLLRKRSEMVGDLEHLTSEALNRPDGAGEHSAMPIHMADLGTDNWEQEFTLGLAENERTRLLEIDEALERIEKKTYGICLATHEPIGIDRLRAQPWTKYCIEHARMRDEGRVR